MSNTRTTIKEMGGIQIAPKNKKYSFKVKWSATIENHGHTDIPNLILLNLSWLDITAAEFLTLVAILSFKWDKNDPWPSNDTISKRANCTRSTIRKHTQSLERKGLLKRIPQTGFTNVYDVTGLRLKLEELAKRSTLVSQKAPHSQLNSEQGEESILTPKEDLVEEDKLIKPINKSVSNDTDESNVLIIYNFYIKAFKKDTIQCRLNDKRKALIQARLKDCGQEMIMRAIDNTSLNEWYTGKNDSGWQADLDYILQSSQQVEKMTNLQPSEELIKKRKSEKAYEALIQGQSEAVI